MAPSCPWKAAVPRFSLYIEVIFCFISLLVCRTSSSCTIGDGKYDFSALDWPPWNVTVKVSDIVTHYQLSLCKPLNASEPCKSSAICKRQDESLTDLGIYTENATFTEDDAKAGFTLKYEGASCTSERKYTTYVHFHCGSTLGSPSYVYSSKCGTYFTWQTSVACSKPSLRKQVPCYVYNKDGKKHDLSFLTYASGAHFVKSSQTSIGFFINVCSDIAPGNATPSCPPGVAACRKIGNEALDFGQPTSPLSVDKDGNLRLEYISSNGTKAAGCDLQPHTTITFVCPLASRDSSVMKQISGPTLTSLAECQYAVEWVTDYACPVEDHINIKDCMISDDERGIYADLSILRKPNDLPYHIPATVDGTARDFYLNICGGLQSSCQKKVTSSTSVCLKSAGDPEGIILGSNLARTIRIYGGDVSLTYGGTEKCTAEPNAAVETTINFRCNASAADTKPTFDHVSDCTYIFEWETSLVCPHKIDAHQCIAGNETHLVDLSMLTKRGGSSAWDVVTSSVTEFATSQIAINVCGSVGNEGLMGNCPVGSAVCLKGSETSSVQSLGRYTSSPQVDGKNVILHYKEGSNCPGTDKKKMSSAVTFICKPGESESGPYLTEVSADKCTFFFEWETSAACPLSRFNGSNCNVYDKNLSFNIDLAPLQRNGVFHVETDEYNFYLGVCGEISNDPCDSKGTHAACQVLKTNTSRAWILGTASSNLQYFDGFVNLTYTGGTPYHNAEKTPRQTTISFLCSPSVGYGKPEFVEEANQVYKFKWYTSLVCPAKPVECVVVDDKNARQYDLSALTRLDGQSNWEVAGNVKGKTKKFLVNVCHPLVAVDGCSSDVAACEVDGANSKDVTNIGQATTGPYVDSAGKLVLNYKLGDKCERGGPNATFEAFIYFMCSEVASGVEALRFSSFAGCTYTFVWETSAACPLSDVRNADNCKIKDPSSGTIFDLQSLRKSYSVATKGDMDFQSFEIALCGAPLSSECKVANGTVATVCGHKGAGNATQVLGVSADAQLEIPQAGKLLVTYHSADYNHDTGSATTVVQIALLCQQDVSNELMKFAHKDASHYYFEMETPVACSPVSLPCSVVDRIGNTYDLSTLVRSDGNWIVQDTRDGHSDLTYYINVCRPLLPIQGTDCVGSDIGACQVAMASNKSFNLGEMISQPQVSESGVLTVRYTGGTPCHDGQFRRSTRITFYCSAVQHDPVFMGETEECEYLISWDTPAACATKQTTGKSCSVDDPVYGHHFDLSPLKEKGVFNVSDGDHHYNIGLCRAVACGTDTSAGVCQIKGEKQVNAGNFSEKIIFNDGVLSLVYSGGKGNCHGKYNRTTKIEFRCSQQDSVGPVFLEESFDCSYLFLWETPFACVPATTVECSAHDGSGLLYDLSSLSLYNSSHEYITPDGKEKFLINVCRSVSSSEVSARCEYSSGVCFVNMTEQDRSKKFVNLGSVRHEPYFEDGILKLKYELGETCSNGHHEVVIAFHCDKSKLESEPSLLKREGCSWYFVWDTAAACPVNNVGEGSVRSDCKATNPVSGFEYDLNLLKNSSGYQFEDNTGHKFLVNVCGRVELNSCGSKSGSCQFEESGTQHWNAGEVNSEVHLHEGGLFLNYTGGDPCHNGQFHRSTIIRFICAQDAGLGSPSFMAESDDCTYYVTWHTNLACEKHVHCTVNDGDRIIDLSPLTKTSTHHLAIGGDDRALFLINVCRPLNPVPGFPCPSEAAACMTSLGSSTPLNLGMVESSPFIDSIGRVVLEYSHGSPCITDPSVKTRTRIIFFCEKGAEEGIPELVHITNDCQYVFKWLTSVVCEKDSVHAVIPTSSSSCVFIDQFTQMRFDLSALNSGTGHQVGNRKDFLVSLCSAFEGTSGCAGAAVCNQSVSLGSAASVRASYQDSSLWLLFENGTNCSGNESARWSSSFEFVCDPMAGPGSPVIVDQFSCSVHFHWKTNVVCSSLTSACTVFSNNQLYDLRRIASISHSWNFTDSEGNQYWINVCSGLRPSDQNVGCPQDATVCVKNQKGSFYILGHLETQKLFVDNKTDAVLLQYSGPPSDFCKGEKEPQTTIKLVCSHERGVPILISRTDCNFVFEWKTFEACPANKKNEVLEWSKGRIYDKDLDVSIDLTAYINVMFTTIEVRGKDNYTYEVMLDPTSLTRTACRSAGVCQTKDDSNFSRSVGLVEKAEIYRRGAELQMVLPSNSHCGRSKKRNNATATIIFQCVTEDIKNPLSFVFESLDCSYIFNWKTNAVCLWSANNIQHIAVLSGSGGGHSMSTGAIFAIVGLVIFLLVLVGVLLNNQTRRAMLVTTLRQFWRRSRKSPVYRYSVLPSHDNAQNETTSLLTPEADGQHSLQAFHEEDSDDEVLII